MRNLTWVLVALVGVMTACNRSDTQLTATAIDRTTTPDSFLQFTNNPPEINNNDYTQKYYDTVDPTGERMTLAAWKSKNGFDSGVDVHVTFRDTRDLGYGRDMYARCSLKDANGACTGDIAIFVDNYVVQLEPGDASTYGPLNLDAAIDRVQKYHIGTNTIEFSADPNNAAFRIAKFFAFAPRDANGTQHRLNSLDMDGRGIKSMPNMCAVCHGGAMYPLRSDGSFDPISLKSLKLNILEDDAFQFSSRPGFTKSDQQAGIKAINRLVFDTYALMNLRQDSDTDQANWDSTFAMDLVDGAYGNNFSTPLTPESEFKEAFVPTGWTQDGNRPQGIEDLYRTVIRPHCIGCHGLRGTKVAQNNSANTINFSTFEKFKAHNNRSIDYVYRRGNMPASLLNFSNFWINPQGAPLQLSQFLDAFPPVLSPIVKPGKSVAIADHVQMRNIPGGKIQLDGSASLFTVRYSWSIETALGTASLSGETTSMPELLLTPTSGAVTLKLVTSNSRGDSSPLTVTISGNDSLATVPTFEGNVRSILSVSCVSCHSAGGVTGIPVFFTADDDLYRRVRARVNIREPESSLLLVKATNQVPHGGGTLMNEQATNYHTILNWIRAGAPEGQNTPPVANAGPDQDITSGLGVTLTGSASSDPDGNPLTYAWTLISRPSGSNAVLSDSSGINPTFTADAVGTYTVSLIVNDGRVDSSSDTITITASPPPNNAPVASIAPSNITVPTCAPLTLTGSGNDSDSDPLSFQWSLTGKPPGSTLVLTDSTTKDQTITPDLGGTFTFTLVVNDGANASGPAGATVNADWTVFSTKCDSCHDLDVPETGPALGGKGATVRSRFANPGDAHYTVPLLPLQPRVSPMLTSCQINEVATFVDTQ